MRLIYFPFAIFFICSSCKTYTAIRKMNSEDATFELWKNGSNKTVTFLSMTHLGKPEFYEDVRQTITSFKKEGYVVFYEGVKAGHIPDSVFSAATIKNYTKYPEVRTRNRDSLNRLIYNVKFRRMTGFYPDTAFYSNLTESQNLFKNKMAQPNVGLLGITNSDFNVDVTIIELVNLYEKSFGEITLEQIDFAVPLNEPLPGFRKLNKISVSTIIIDHRNYHLANSIQNSNHSMILVLYGMAHKNGTFEVLKHFDSSWKILKQ